MLRQLPLATSPSMLISITGKWYLSTRRDATMPITPACQPSFASTIAVSMCSYCASIFSASIKISRLIFCLSVFSSFSASAISAARASSCAVKSSTASCACSSLPTALSLGASIKPIFSEVISLTGQRLFSISAFSPMFSVVSIFLSPCLTSARFSPHSGTISATVPKATNSVLPSHSGSSGKRIL